jgi:hypothetical protein
MHRQMPGIAAPTMHVVFRGLLELPDTVRKHTLKAAAGYAGIVRECRCFQP